jgi:hypothetical protein
MKLTDLFEMTHQAGVFPDYSPEIIARTVKGLLDGAQLITKLEGGKIFLYKNYDYYFLQKEHNILGFLRIDDQGKEYELKLIYVLPEFRKKSVAVLLVYAVKEVINKPLIIKYAVFNGGEKLIDMLYQHKRYPIRYRKSSGQVIDYTPGMIPKEEDGGDILIEHGGEGFWINPLDKLGLVEEEYWRYFTRFPELCDLEK